MDGWSRVMKFTTRAILFSDFGDNRLVLVNLAQRVPQPNVHSHTPTRRTQVNATHIKGSIRPEKKG